MHCGIPPDWVAIFTTSPLCWGLKAVRTARIVLETRLTYHTMSDLQLGTVVSLSFLEIEYAFKQNPASCDEEEPRDLPPLAAIYALLSWTAGL